MGIKMLGLWWKHSAVTLLLMSVTVFSSSTALNCLPGYYFDGKGCTKCTQCPLGYGLKNHCSDTEDTQCQPCIEGYDYSDTSGLDECIL
ncbi:tumor necrosis factor receptor superfamily member 4-like [Stylophora pistillata]|uniref:tumor necrosis factor receptor superfamily member 4-like n=1 Tax=Stylophora pistillata TaxID=50429 RepID=UPI000C0521A8|nr:tumor necrosis factor receptor superfamily member 4-like [Stylophora pistillata]